MKAQPCFSTALLAAIALASTACVINVDADQVVVREEKQFKVGKGADVTLETFDGSIRVDSWDQPDVRVEIQKRGPDKETAAALEVRASQDGNRVRVEAPNPKVRREFIGIGNYSGPSVSFVVRLPQDVALNAVTHDGSITIQKVKGKVNLRSGDGSIRTDGIVGDLTAHTNDGSLTILGGNGRMALESGDGSVRVEGRVDDLQIRTGDGSIDVEADEGSAMKADWRVTTGDGSITLRLPQQFNADIEADSRDGRVHSNIEGLTARRDDDDRGSIRGRIGGGGHTLTLRSGDGSISVLRR